MAKKLWPGESPVGKCVIIRKRTAGCSTVVGLAEDTPAMQLLETKPYAQYFVPMRAVVDSESVAPGAIIVRTRNGEWRAADAIVRAELHASAPAATVMYNAMMNYMERELRPFRLGATLFTAFGLLALFVAGVGVYGVIAYSFSQRNARTRRSLGARRNRCGYIPARARRSAPIDGVRRRSWCGAVAGTRETRRVAVVCHFRERSGGDHRRSCAARISRCRGESVASVARVAQRSDGGVAGGIATPP